MRAGDYTAACPKLQTASKLYEGPGVLLNLGDCYEHLGHTASAWAEFGEAASAARRVHRPADEGEAKRRQAALEPHLARLVVRVKIDAPGLVVKRDGHPFDRTEWGLAMPVDPGSHDVAAEAPGLAVWAMSVVAEPGKTMSVDVPELTSSAAPPSAEAAHEEPPPSVAPNEQRGSAPAPSAPYWTGRRVVGAVTAGAGLVGVGVGFALALSAKSQFDAAGTESGSSRHDDSVKAVNTGNVATAVSCIGAAVGAAGAVFWLLAPARSTSVGIDGSVIFVRRRF